jgi:hypothetical protein
LQKEQEKRADVLFQTDFHGKDSGSPQDQSLQETEEKEMIGSVIGIVGGVAAALHLHRRNGEWFWPVMAGVGVSNLLSGAVHLLVVSSLAAQEYYNQQLTNPEPGIEPGVIEGGALAGLKGIVTDLTTSKPRRFGMLTSRVVRPRNLGCSTCM